MITWSLKRCGSFLKSHCRRTDLSLNEMGYDIIMKREIAVFLVGFCLMYFFFLSRVLIVRAVPAGRMYSTYQS